MKTMYLETGEEVQVIRKLEDGWLYQLVLTNDYGEDFIFSEATYFIDKLFEKPPMPKLHKELIDLNKQIAVLKDERRKQQSLNQEVDSLASDIPNFAFIQMLVDYMNKDYNFVMYEENYEIFEKAKLYHSPYVKVVNSKSGYQLYKLRSENYAAYDDRPIRIFVNLEDAKEWAAKHAIDKLKAGLKREHPWGQNQVESWYKNINYSCKVREHPDVKREFEAAMELTRIRDAKAAKEKLEKEIAEKKEKLEKLK